MTHPPRDPAYRVAPAASVNTDPWLVPNWCVTIGRRVHPHPPHESPAVGGVVGLCPGWADPTPPPVPPEPPRTFLGGVYRHYKGPLYNALALAHDANADDLISNLHLHAGPLGERVVVVYHPMELGGAHAGPRLAIRTREDFDLTVCGCPDCEFYGTDVTSADCTGNHVVRRFRYLGPEYDPTDPKFTSYTPPEL